MNFKSKLEELIANLYWVSKTNETWEIISVDKELTSDCPQSINTLILSGLLTLAGQEVITGTLARI